MPVTGFISRSACRGRRPSSCASYVVQSRPALVGQLLKSRDVARFIVAPSGYGKSYLALEYAETMRSWLHTFWVNAQSPCFVRELDAGVLTSYIFELDSEASLVVIDDLPTLDAGCQSLLSSEIDALLSRGCEVIVTCVPTCDTLGAYQPDRLVMRSSSLLLSDEELDDIRSPEERLRRSASKVGAAQRVPLLAWAREGERGRQFVQGVLAEELPGDLLFVAASALVLHKGRLSELLELGSLEKHVFQEMADDYPHLGIDAESDSFEAPLVVVDELAGPVQKSLGRLVASTPYEAVEQLVRAWASALLSHGEAVRACEVVQKLCPHGRRAAWLLDNAIELVRHACFLTSLRLITSLGNCGGEQRLQLDAFEALCRRVLGDEAGAIQCANRCAFNGRSPEDARTLGLLLLARLNGGELTRRACDVLADRDGDEASDPCQLPTGELLTRAWQAQVKGGADLAQVWMRYYEAGVNDDVLCICASWYFSLYDDSEHMPQQDELLACRQIERYVRNGLSSVVQQKAVDYYLASAGLSMEDAHKYGLAFEGGPLDTASLIALRQVEMDIVSQRRYFEEDARIEQARRNDWVTTHPASLSSLNTPGKVDLPERSIPVLTLKMFGCFEASIGGVPLEHDRFKRQNSRVLLVLLAVNQGREVSRDVIAEKMWPRSSIKVARKNFYSAWSHLRKALSLPDGTCPYLVRHRYGCSLDGRLVHSDVERLNAICRELLFGVPNIDHWSLLFAEIDRDFSSDLMPAEEDNVFITQARNDLRTRLVDALVAATESIIVADAPQWGVWFARAALSHDDTREDAYVALMRAQIAVNQRTAAMMTYLKCRRVLSEKLGIDPSPETTALYESLLE